MLSGFSRIQLCVTVRSVARWAPLPMGFSRQRHWSGLPCPLPVDLPNPGNEPESHESPALQADSLLTEPPGKPRLLILCIKEITNENLLYSTGTSTQCSVVT